MQEPPQRRLEPNRESLHGRRVLLAHHAERGGKVDRADGLMQTVVGLSEQNATR